MQQKKKKSFRVSKIIRRTFRELFKGENASYNERVS